MPFMRWKSINPPPCSRTMPANGRSASSIRPFQYSGTFPFSMSFSFPNAFSITSGSRGSTVRSIRSISGMTASLSRLMTNVPIPALTRCSGSLPEPSHITAGRNSESP